MINSKDIDIEREWCKKSALAFFNTACLIESQPEYWEFKGTMLSPYTVNLMLSCELFYKYFLLPYKPQMGDKCFKTHSLEKLHMQLKKYEMKTACRIEELYYQNNIGIHSFEKTLKLNGFNFVEFRYLFDFEQKKKKEMHTTDVAAVAHALIRVCDSCVPRFQQQSHHIN